MRYHERDPLFLAVQAVGAENRVVCGPTTGSAARGFLRGFNRECDCEDRAMMAVLVDEQDMYAVANLIDRRRCADELRDELKGRGLQRLIKDREAFRALVDIYAEKDEARMREDFELVRDRNAEAAEKQEEQSAAAAEGGAV